MDTEIEKRLIRLEELGYFQEEKLKALDSQLLEQQAQLDHLEQEVEHLQHILAQTRGLLSELSGGGGGKPEAEIPPHSHSTGWRF